ncbi:uncharacterized protein LOC115034675 [Acyrthosiphon pisum]|uniref:Uncharacterized protein n=1 Tax=Acyrthosiphon pisum TaxID=7029 RepID=A0A8R2NTC5_ACYPI|nr:uncharacterized protein LOC115034675 [Acyrthosiphon pisum]
MDKVTFQHDVDYNNMTNPTKDQVWEADKKSMLAAMNTTDKYYGNIATIVGLGLKNIAERTHEAITGSNSAIYPQCGRVQPDQKDNDAQGAESKGNAEPADTTTKSTNNTDSSRQLRTDHQHVDNFDNNFSTSGNNMETPTSSSKRPADSPAGSAFSKKSNMVLPGTASATASDSDTGNPSPENAVSTT